MTCEGCKTDPQPESFGSPRKCAFPNGVFTSDNWSCVTMDGLRDLADSMFYTSRFSDDSVALLPYMDDDGFASHIVMAWYKDRGQTSQAFVLDENGPAPLTLKTALDGLKMGWHVDNRLNEIGHELKDRAALNQLED